MRRGLAAILAISICLFGASAAEAGTLSFNGSTLTYVDVQAGVQNNVDIVESGGRMWLRDSGSNYFVDGASGCTNAGTTVFAGNYSNCPLPASWSLDLGDANDVLTLTPCCNGINVPVSASGGPGNDSLTGGFVADTLNGGSGTDTLNGGNGDDTLDGGPDSDAVNGGSGTDTATYASRSEGVTVNLAAGGNDDGSPSDGPPAARDNVNNTDIEGAAGGDGQDVLTAAGLARPVSLDGRGGADSLTGGSAEDTLDGGGDNDLLDGAGAGDTINGGGGSLDKVTYAGRTENLVVDLGAPGPGDGGASDGASPATRDAINGADVEGVIGGSGDDTLTGSGTPHSLEGGPGGDLITAGGGPGNLAGGTGNDSITGGNAGDSLDGGTGNDTLRPDDGSDSVFGGAGSDDIDSRDGVADTIDCGPDLGPTLTDSSDTRINCDPPPAQSQSSQPAQSQGSSTAAPPTRLLVSPSFKAIAGRTSTKLTSLVVKKISAGSRLTAKCRTKKGRKCPRVKDYAKSNVPASLRLRGFEKKALPVGAKIEIRVTKTGTIGAVKVLTVRKSKKPSVLTRCLPPGATRPAKC